MFDQRKMVIIIFDKSESIAEAILRRLQRGRTFLFGRGAYTGQRKKVLLTVINNYQLKRLDEAVFTIDSEAFFIILRQRNGLKIPCQAMNLSVSPGSSF